MFVAPRVSKVDGKPQLYYLCTSKHKTGARSCTNRYALPYEQITEALVGHFREDFLRPEVLGGLLMNEIDRQRQDPAAAESERQAVQADVKRLDRELAQLAQEVAAGGDIPALVTTMQNKQRQRETAAATSTAWRGWRRPLRALT